MYRRTCSRSRGSMCARVPVAERGRSGTRSIPVGSAWNIAWSPDMVSSLPSTPGTAGHFRCRRAVRGPGTGPDPVRSY